MCIRDRAPVDRVVGQLLDGVQGLPPVANEGAQLRALQGHKNPIVDVYKRQAVSYEALAFATCFGTEDQKEGMQAFLEKRKEKHFKNK